MAVEKESLMSISEVYHENTKDRRRLAPIMSNLPQQHGPWYKAFKRHLHKPQVKLAKPVAEGCEAATCPLVCQCMSAFDNLAQSRRSVRHFSADPLTLDEVNHLMYFSNGITAEMPLAGGGTLPLRASPSAGALYPIELYPIVFAAQGLEPGVYHYEPGGHTLEFLKQGDFKELCYEISHGQEMVRESAMVVAMVGVFDRTKAKYGERGYRYVLLDAGHLAQNLYLESTVLDLGCCTIGGFLDDEANHLLGLDGLSESVVYLAVVGRPSTDANNVQTPLEGSHQRP